MLYRNVKIRLSAPKYHWIDTLFALPEAVLYADIIDLMELKLGVTRVPYWKLFDDIRASIDECHRDGSLKTIVIPRYNCPEAEGVIGGALLEMMQGGDYKPTGKNPDGWYRGNFGFAFEG